MLFEPPSRKWRGEGNGARLVEHKEAMLGQIVSRHVCP
jgi:hypothetical protein